MNAIAGWLLGIGALLLGGLWMPALVVALVAVAFSAAKDDPEPIATLELRSWEEPMPDTEEWVDAPPMPNSRGKVALGPERTRIHAALFGECVVHDCPACDVGAVTVRASDGSTIKECSRC